MRILVLLLWLASLSALQAQTTEALVMWDISPSLDANGYKIYQGPSTRTYTNNYVVPGDRLTTSYILTNLTWTWTYFITATAYTTNGVESDYSNEVEYLVPYPPVIVTGPVSTTNSIGNTQTFAVVVTGGDLKYQWSKDGMALTDGGSVSGAATDTLTLSLTGPEMGTYWVLVKGAGGTVTSAPAVLSLIPAAPADLKVTEYVITTPPGQPLDLASH